MHSCQGNLSRAVTKAIPLPGRLLPCATAPADMPNARIGHLAPRTRPHQRKPWLRHEATGTGEAEQERRVAQPRPNSPPRQRQENQIVASGSQFCSCTWTVVNVLQCPPKRLVRSAHLEARDVLAPARQRSSGSAQRTRVPNARKVLAKCGGTLRSHQVAPERAQQQEVSEQGSEAESLAQAMSMSLSKTKKPQCCW